MTPEPLPSLTTFGTSLRVAHERVGRRRRRRRATLAAIVPLAVAATVVLNSPSVTAPTLTASALAADIAQATDRDGVLHVTYRVRRNDGVIGLTSESWDRGDLSRVEMRTLADDRTVVNTVVQDGREVVNRVDRGGEVGVQRFRAREGQRLFRGPSWLDTVKHFVDDPGDWTVTRSSFEGRDALRVALKGTGIEQTEKDSMRTVLWVDPESYVPLAEERHYNDHPAWDDVIVYDRIEWLPATADRLRRMTDTEGPLLTGTLRAP